MKRHFYISDDLDDLEHVEEELEENGFVTPQIHVLSLNDAGVAQHSRLNEVEPVLRKDVVRGTEIGAVIGVICAALVLLIVWLAGWPQTTTWIPFIFLAIIILGFCTWEGGLFGIQEPHKQYRRFQEALKAGKHVFFVDAKPEQEDILARVIHHHPKLQLAGVDSSRPGIVIWWQDLWRRFMDSAP